MLNLRYRREYVRLKTRGTDIAVVELVNYAVLKIDAAPRMNVPNRYRSEQYEKNLQDPRIQCEIKMRAAGANICSSLVL